MRKIKPLLFFLKIFLFIYPEISFAKIEDSSDIFFPQSLKYLQVAQAEFPVFWWNFVVINPHKGQGDFKKAKEVCQELKKQLVVEIKNLICENEIESFFPVLQEWADDLIYREPFMTSAEAKNIYQAKLNSAFAEMSLVSLGDKKMFLLKQKDPFDQWETYLKKSKVFADIFKKNQGFLYDQDTKRIIIPVQFLAEPKMKNVEATMNSLAPFAETYLVGPHGSAYFNEQQVHKDLDLVARVGFAVFAIFILYLLMIGRLAALLLIPPVVVALGLAAWGTELIYGGIHGLTLAFGSGIVGLTMDYGLHGAFNSESKQTWQSNSIGLFTTLVGLGVLVFSGIPLIQQMMVFGILGLVFGFILYYLLCRYFPRQFAIKSVQVHFPDFKYSWVLVILLIGGGLYGAKKLNFEFDLRRFNYQTQNLKEVTDWFYSKGNPSEQFLVLHSRSDVYSKTSDEFNWAQKNKIPYVGLSDFIPDLSAQKRNISSWENEGCVFFKKQTPASVQKVFTPFINNLCDIKHFPLQFAELEKKTYLNPFIGNNKFLTLFFAENEDQQNRIKRQYPEAHSLTESIKGFSTSLEKDLLWMVPAAILLSFLILLFYYKKMVIAFVALIPFFTGLGLFFVVSAVFNKYLDLISVLGLLMVFGFSIDYGVFSTDCQVFPHSRREKAHVDTALWFAAVTNIIGFFPMIFVKHPILYQLGFALFYGTIGTYLGARWGIPVALRVALKNKPEELLD